MILGHGRTQLNYGLIDRTNESTQIGVLASFIELNSLPVELIAGKLNSEGIKGKISCAGECAIANYFVKLLSLANREEICVSVAPDMIYIAWKSVSEIHLPLGEDSNIQRFIGYFDDNAFPELVEED